MKRFLPLLTSAVFLSGALPLWADEPTEKPLTRAEVESIVKKVIEQNPDFVLKTLIDYNEKQKLKRVSDAAQNVVKMQETLNHDPRAPSIGNAKGDVTVTEFFDYHCGYCKRFFPEVTQLLGEDKHVNVVFREFPILSDDSVLAARAALAVYSIDKAKYFDYHILLMKASGGFNEEVLAAKAKSLGISGEAFMKAYNDPAVIRDLVANKELAKKLNITATPTIVIGSEVMPGAIPYSVLKDKIEEARASQQGASSAVK